MRLRVFFVLLLVGGIARADTVHAGLDVRSDLGAHHARIPIGFHKGDWDATLVLDPAYALDGEHDLDAIGERFFGPHIGALFGWRWSAVSVAGGHHHQHRSLIGLTAVGPSFLEDHIRTRFSVELATLWFKHGGGATETFSASIDRNLIDAFSLGVFVRFEYAQPI